MLTHETFFGPYALLGKLNTGGMAEVFLAKGCVPPLEGKLLALKRILPRYSDDANFAAMFMDEARILSHLNHPHICTIYDHGQLHHQLYLVMEFIHGKDLAVIKQRLDQRDRTMPYDIVAWIIARMAEALDHAHSQRTRQGQPIGIVHRDVCPSNIIVGYDGLPKLIDFGIAKAAERLAHTRVGMIKGKAVYMSPEQVQGHPIDSRSDIFSLGLVAYELIAGKTPFDGPTEYDVMRNIAQNDFQPLVARKWRIPEVLAQAVHRALQKDPARRFQRASEFAEALALTIAFGERRRQHRIGPDTVSATMHQLFANEYEHEQHRIQQFAVAPVQSPVPEAMDAGHTQAIATGFQSATSLHAPMASERMVNVERASLQHTSIGDYTIEYPVHPGGWPVLTPEVALQIASPTLNVLAQPSLQLPTMRMPLPHSMAIGLLSHNNNAQPHDVQELAPGYLRDGVAAPLAAEIHARTGPSFFGVSWRALVLLITVAILAILAQSL